MEELVTIKQEPEWIIEDEYAPSQLYKEDSNVAYTEYEIKPYYDSDIDFDYYKCKVGFYLFIFFFFIHLFDWECRCSDTYNQRYSRWIFFCI